MFLSTFYRRQLNKIWFNNNNKLNDRKNSWCVDIINGLIINERFLARIVK